MGVSAVIAILGLLFCVAVALGVLATVTLQACAIFCGVLFVLILIFGFVPSTAYPWARR